LHTTSNPRVSLLSQSHLASVAGSPKLALEVLPGFMADQKHLHPKLFYDEEGCRLFQRITELPEYYLTRTERDLLAKIAGIVAGRMPTDSVLVEYGASDESKASYFLRQQSDDGSIFRTYMPIDIAMESLIQIRRRLWKVYPQLQVIPIQTDFTTPVSLPQAIRTKAKLGFFPGSTVGNYMPNEAENLLREINRTLGRDAYLIIGADLRKDPRLLLPAYNDRAGVTAAFNRNILTRLNRDAGADFDLTAFSHRAIWNDEASRIEMHLVSERQQTIHLGGAAIDFQPNETIHTENSYKYTIETFLTIADRAGWSAEEVWTDSDDFFALYLLKWKHQPCVNLMPRADHTH